MGGVSDEWSQGPTTSSARPPRFLAGFAALALTLLSTSPAPAQQDPRPFQVRASLKAEGEYTDNFFLSEKNKREEFREILTPGASFQLSTGRSQAVISYAPSLVHSSLNDEEVRVFHLFDANGSLALTERLTLRAGDHFLRSDDQTLTDPRGIRRDRTILLQNTLNTDLTYNRDTWSLTPRYAMTLNRTESENGGATSQGGNLPATGSDERSIVHTLGADGALNILDRNTL